jgi:hypothetical protein
MGRRTGTLQTYPVFEGGSHLFWSRNDLTLDIFGKATGLIVNRSKCAVYPIHCEEIDIEDVMEDFTCPIKNFPCVYLGLPLHFRALHRVEIQPLVDKMANRLSSWKGKFLNKAGRLKLMNTVLSTTGNGVFAERNTLW